MLFSRNREHLRKPAPDDAHYASRDGAVPAPSGFAQAARLADVQKSGRPDSRPISNPCDTGAGSEQPSTTHLAQPRPPQGHRGPTTSITEPRTISPTPPPRPSPSPAPSRERPRIRLIGLPAGGRCPLTLCVFDWGLRHAGSTSRQDRARGARCGRRTASAPPADRVGSGPAEPTAKPSGRSRRPVTAAGAGRTAAASTGDPASRGGRWGDVLPVCPSCRLVMVSVCRLQVVRRSRAVRAGEGWSAMGAVRR